MLNKLIKRINNLKERIIEERNERKRPITDEEILNYFDSLTKEEKQMYARLYRGN